MKDYDIVIRCRNESASLPICLDKINAQSVQPKRVVVVDNGSEDLSADIARSRGCDIVPYPENELFNYSKALNIGIYSTTSKYILILSAHCIMVHNECAEIMLEVFDLFDAGCVYGRQLPTVNSNAVDTRDLLTVFGRERVIYEKYPFFHNAFSMIKRSLWEAIPFDQNINGIEDRIWARNVCKIGHKIIYELDPWYTMNTD
jgi:glycosyltransferase involved in cell wall biosynthesis